MKLSNKRIKDITRKGAKRKEKQGELKDKEIKEIKENKASKFAPKSQKKKTNDYHRKT